LDHACRAAAPLCHTRAMRMSDTCLLLAPFRGDSPPTCPVPCLAAMHNTETTPRFSPPRP
jgi:hypothetical protein